MNYTKSVEKWGVFEFCSEGTTAGNPFMERSITALFESDSERKTVNGFYDGNGIYKVRFMPSFEEEYHFTVCWNFSDSKYEGTFSVTPPSENNHGCVKVHNKYHFSIPTEHHIILSARPVMYGICKAMTLSHKLLKL